MSIPNDRRKHRCEKHCTCTGALIAVSTQTTSEITKRYYARRYVIATSVESLECSASLLSRNPRSRRKSYLALILDQEKTIIFERLSRRLEISVGNAWSRSMCPKLSTQQRNNFVPLHGDQSDEKCQSGTLYRFFLSTAFHRISHDP